MPDITAVTINTRTSNVLVNPTGNTYKLAGNGLQPASNATVEFRGFARHLYHGRAVNVTVVDSAATPGALEGTFDYQMVDGTAQANVGTLVAFVCEKSNESSCDERAVEANRLPLA